MATSPRHPVPDHFEVTLDQQIFTLGEYPNFAPLRHGKKVHISNGFRQAATGSRGDDGTWVKLPWMRFAGRRWTSVEALQWFSDRLSRRPDEPAASTPCGPRKAARELDKIGI
jgi:hypothetical protein